MADLSARIAGRPGHEASPPAPPPNGVGSDDARPDPIAADVAAVARIDAMPTLLDVVCRTTGMGFAAVARVTDDRWVACGVKDDIAFGLGPGGELEVATTICSEVRDSGRGVFIDHVAEDAAYCGHLTPARYGFQSYVSVPIVLPDGRFFGTLCAIDPEPRSVNRPEVTGMFRLFAELIAFHLDARLRIDESDAALAGEREDAKLREQFIAVLGHDLRNPLASIDAGTKLLSREALGEKATRIVGLIQSSVERMAGLIDNVLDLARGRLGDGLPLARGEAALGPVLEQVVAELSAAWPGRAIETRFALDRPVRCDPGRIGQMLSNLVANALAHGSADAPVRVEASSGAGGFTLSVANAGEPIPPAVMEHLFEPFFRMDARPSGGGLGLGLYIVSEIARAHGGTVEVSSTPEETRMTFRMAAG